jgi:hypothetical protein
VGYNDGYQAYNGPGESATSLTLEGYNGANLVGTATIPLSFSAFVYTPVNFNNITELEFIGVGPNSGSGWVEYWGMDNLEYTPVPEPISMIFFGTGLVAVGGYVSRRRMMRKA